LSTRTMRLILRTSNHYFHTKAHSTGNHQQHSKFEFEADSTFHFEFDTSERVVYFQLEVKMDTWKTIGNAELNMMQVHKRKISILITNGEAIVGELSLNGSDITRKAYQLNAESKRSSPKASPSRARRASKQLEENRISGAFESDLLYSNPVKKDEPEQKTDPMPVSDTGSAGCVDLELVQRVCMAHLDAQHAEREVNRSSSLRSLANASPMPSPRQSYIHFAPDVDDGDIGNANDLTVDLDGPVELNNDQEHDLAAEQPKPFKRNKLTKSFPIQFGRKKKRNEMHHKPDEAEHQRRKSVVIDSVDKHRLSKADLRNFKDCNFLDARASVQHEQQQQQQQQFLTPEPRKRSIPRSSSNTSMRSFLKNRFRRSPSRPR